MIIGFTGHRPDKLPNKETGYKLPNPTYIKVCKELDSILKELKPDKVISGMALGFDQYAAYISMKLNIPVIAAVPFKGQENAWIDSSKRVYNILLKKSSEVVIVSPGDYSAAKMQIRNQWIVDNCDLLVACWDGKKNGGTYNCIEYASSLNKKMIIIDPNI